MKAVTANEAKTQFGDMLMSVQRAPVQISKNGKPVAVMVSAEDYEKMEDLKMQMLKDRVQRAKAEIEAGATTEGDPFFDELLAETGVLHSSMAPSDHLEGRMIPER